eukprot:IDg9199t1
MSVRGIHTRWPCTRSVSPRNPSADYALQFCQKRVLLSSLGGGAGSTRSILTSSLVLSGRSRTIVLFGRSNTEWPSAIGAILCRLVNFPSELFSTHMKAYPTASKSFG